MRWDARHAFRLLLMISPSEHSDPLLPGGLGLHYTELD